VKGGVALKLKALDAFHLLMILSSQEQKELGLDIHSLHTLHNRLTIAHLISAACDGTDFLPRTGQITIRAMETEDGQCVLMFSAPPKKRKVYKVKSPIGPYLYRFPSAGDLLSAMERLYRTEACCGDCRLFLLDGSYVLLIFPRCSLRPATDCLLREYSEYRGKGPLAAAFITEHGKLISQNPIAEIGSSLTGQPPEAP
jgi:hypothetical protein